MPGRIRRLRKSRFLGSFVHRLLGFFVRTRRFVERSNSQPPCGMNGLIRNNLTMKYL